MAQMANSYTLDPLKIKSKQINNYYKGPRMLLYS